MDLGLAGRVAIITGGCGGIGQACSLMLAGEGVRVVAADADAARVAEFRRLAQHSEISPEILDVTNESQVREFFESVAHRFGRLDILINAAGVLTPTSVEEVTRREWTHVHDINLFGVFLCCREAIGIMQKRRSGAIVNIASMAGQNPGKITSVHYATSKAGVANLTRFLAKRYGGYGIRVNTVNPGVIQTSMTAGTSHEVLAEYAEKTPLGRIGRPEEVATAILFLVSDLSSFVHGAHLDVNGGFLTD